MNIKIISSYLPKNFLTKKKLKSKLGKNYNRIIEYTGFKKIHVLSKKNDYEEFIIKSTKHFIRSNNINSKNIDALIYSSHTRKREMPNFCTKIQEKLKLDNQILAYDLPNSCSAFTNGLIHSHSFLKSNLVKNVILICSDFHSHKILEHDTSLYPVLGDGLSIIYIEKNNENSFISDWGVQGFDRDVLKIENNKIHMDGIKVFEFASERVPQTVNRILVKNKQRKIDYIVLHQPNKSINEHIMKKLNFKKEKFLINYDHGNLSASSIPVNICKNFSNKTLINKRFMFVGFGSGLSWSSAIIKLIKVKINRIKFYG